MSQIQQALTASRPQRPARSFFSLWLLWSLRLALTLLVTDCSSSYQLLTLPDDAEIFAADKSLGKSPADFSGSDLPEQAKKAGGYLLRVVKAGYRPLYVWVPEGGRSYHFTLNLLPFYQKDRSTDLLEAERDFSTDELNQLADQAMFAQDNLINGNTVEAALIQDLIASHPNLGSAHFLKALESLRGNKKDEAKTYLTDAIRFSPLEKDFLSLRNEIGEKK